MSEKKKIVIKIDLSIYDRTAALKTCHVFQDRFHTSLDAETGSIAIATLVPRRESTILADIEKQFKDELIDQQIRLENERLFSWIRQLIVEQAFRPVAFSKLKEKVRK